MACTQRRMNTIPIPIVLGETSMRHRPDYIRPGAHYVPLTPPDEHTGNGWVAMWLLILSILVAATAIVIAVIIGVQLSNPHPDNTRTSTSTPTTYGPPPYPARAT